MAIDDSFREPPRMLVVEEDFDLMRSSVKIIQILFPGARVDATTKKDKAIEYARETHYDVIINDLGRRSCASQDDFHRYLVGNQPPSVSENVIYQSSVDEYVAARKRDGLNYLLKPFEPPALKELIDIVLHSKRSHRS